ncbi:MAG: 6-phosphogluconolactonase [Crocinitomicaceae bacterium]
MITLKDKEQVESEILSGLLKAVHSAILQYNDARILLSGGNTPKNLYKKFAESKIDWAKVHIGLVDDRNVSVDDDFSNEKMIRNVFYDANVDLVNIYGIVKRKPELGDIACKYEIFKERTDFTILGMGTDGHTASLFPADKASEDLLNSEEISVAETIAPQHPKNRTTCSKGMLKASTNIALMIFGEEKKKVFEQAVDNRKPIAYFIEECPQMKTYYSPIA